MHIKSEPSILYFGTPVVLIGTLNKDATYNLAPMSSIFWLGWRAMLGLSSRSQTTKNMIRTGECVLNLASVDEVAAVDRLALTTGSNPVPESKIEKGYRYEPDKFGIAQLTPIESESVVAPRVKECRVQLEAVVETTNPIADQDVKLRGNLVCIEVRIKRVHIDESILMYQDQNKVDPDKWRPLIMSFQEFYGLGSRLQTSALARIPEYKYRSPDIGRARMETNN